MKNVTVLFLLAGALFVLMLVNVGIDLYQDNIAKRPLRLSEAQTFRQLVTANPALKDDVAAWLKSHPTASSNEIDDELSHLKKKAANIIVDALKKN